MIALVDAQTFDGNFVPSLICRRMSARQRLVRWLPTRITITIVTDCLDRGALYLWFRSRRLYLWFDPFSRVVALEATIDDLRGAS